MNGVRTVYAVVSGEFSDYQIHCLFETQEIAEQYAAQLSERGWSAGGWFPPEPHVETFQLWSVLPVVGTAA